MTNVQLCHDIEQDSNVTCLLHALTHHKNLPQITPLKTNQDALTHLPRCQLNVGCPLPHVSAKSIEDEISTTSKWNTQLFQVKPRVLKTK